MNNMKMKIHSNTNYVLITATFTFLLFTIWIISNSNSNLDIQLKEILERLEGEQPVQTCDCPCTIEKRLDESIRIWERGIERRNDLMKKNLLDLDNPWSFKRGISVWDFFYPTFDCPHTVERIGKSGDGGKWICGFGHLAKKIQPCIVYSYGVNVDTSFEDEIVARTNCSVYMFDHTIDITRVKLPKLHPDRVFIEKVGLGPDNYTNLRSISSTMKKYGHDFIDILKIDVEGAEFKILDNIRNEFASTLPFGQLSMEIHLPVNTTRDDFYKKSIAWLSNLEDMGLRPFRNEFNLLALKRSRAHYPNLCEYSFINIDYDNYLLH